MTARTPLPQRRRSVTVDREWQGRPLLIGIGFDDEARPREVFVTGPKEGSDLAHLLADLCVIVSVALQHDVPLAALRKSLGRVPAWPEGEGHASVAGLILATLGEVAG